MAETSTPGGFERPPARIAVLVVVGVVLGFAVNPEGLRPPRKVEQTPKVSYTAPIITIAELQNLMSRETVVFVDTRTGPDFIQGHIPGALALYGPELELRTREVRRWLSRDAVIVVVDSHPLDSRAKRRAAEFRMSGLPNVRALEGGMQAWRQAGLPTVKGWDMDPVLREARR